ncbi:MAG TPA: hypothetical protein VFU57_03350 [Candidatus Acidoferrales bacterium]|nr:hypothetical protein [Candidatus Acidoferrales bacterium]
MALLVGRWRFSPKEFIAETLRDEAGIVAAGFSPALFSSGEQARG